MYVIVFRKYRSMILASVFFFYFGCATTLFFLHSDCTEASSKIDRYNPPSEIEYAVLVISAPDNEVKRDAIRTTWAKLANNLFIENGQKLYKWNHRVGQLKHQKFIKFYFVMGTQSLTISAITKLKNENSRCNDLLLLNDIDDTYKNLSNKLLRSLQWISENLKGLKYLIKCDDDSFVRIDLIVHDLESYAPEMNAPEISDYVSYKKIDSPKGLYWGYFNGRAQVFLSGKWQEIEWFLCDKYLPYALGGGYVISRNIVDYVSRNAELLSVYNSEDVSMGVWTASLGIINRVHDVRFDTQWKSRGCSDHMVVRHKQTPSEMFQMYESLVQSHGDRLCRIESTDRKSYVYNWNVLPSACCK